MNEQVPESTAKAPGTLNTPWPSFGAQASDAGLNDPDDRQSSAERAHGEPDDEDAEQPDFGPDDVVIIKASTADGPAGSAVGPAGSAVGPEGSAVRPAVKDVGLEDDAGLEHDAGLEDDGLEDNAGLEDDATLTDSQAGQEPAAMKPGSASTAAGPASTTADATAQDGTPEHAPGPASTTADATAQDGTPEHAPGPASTTADATAQDGRPDDAGLLAGGPDDRHERWRSIQLSFVDDPRRSVSEAADFVAQAIGTLIASTQERESALRSEWENEGTDTEGLRIVLKRYRSFLDRLPVL